MPPSPAALVAARRGSGPRHGRAAPHGVRSPALDGLGRRGAGAPRTPPRTRSRRCTGSGGRSCSVPARCRRWPSPLLGWRYAADLAATAAVARPAAGVVRRVAGLAALARPRRRPERALAGAGQPVRVPRAPHAQVGDVGTLLDTYVSRIPYAADDNWPTHVAGHPPGTLLFFVGLVSSGSAATWRPAWWSRSWPPRPWSRCSWPCARSAPRAPPGARRRSWCSRRPRCSWPSRPTR